MVGTGPDSRRFLDQGAFTLIELLVVIMVIAILLAIALPSFLGHQKKAQDSGIQQQLAVAYRVAKANEAANGNASGFSAGLRLVSAITASEPELSSTTVTSSPSSGNLAVCPASSSANLLLAGLSKSGTSWLLNATNAGMTVSAGTCAPAAIATGAGNGVAGFTNTPPVSNCSSGGCVAGGAQFHNPDSLAVDANDSLYVADDLNNAIRLISGAGSAGSSISTYVNTAGTSCTSALSACGDGGSAGSAQLNDPRAIALDSSGNLYIADYNDRRIRKVSGGVITTVAGNGGVGPATIGGSATATGMGGPNAVTVDSSGNLYIAGTDETIYMVPAQSGTYFGQSMTGGDIYTIAGVAGSSGGRQTGVSALSAVFSAVDGLAVDASGNVIAIDRGDNALYYLPASSGTYYGIAMTAGKIYSIALTYPSGITLDSAGNIYTSNYTVYSVDRVTPSGSLATIAGTGSACASATAACGDGGAATSAQFSGPWGVAVDADGNVFVADLSANRIREIN